MKRRDFLKLIGITPTVGLANLPEPKPAKIAEQVITYPMAYQGYSSITVGVETKWEDRWDRYSISVSSY